MTKPVIVTRIGKGSELTFGEGDANFTNLQNATVLVAGDTGTTQVLDLNDTLTVSGGVGLSSVMTTDTVTLNLDNTAVTPASYTNANITVDAQGRITSAANGSAGFTQSDARTAVSATDAGGEGSFAYNNTTGVFTYTGPSFSGLEVTSAKNQNNGYAGLDAGGKVASAQLPSYVDDVEEYAAVANFPVTGETGKIYVATGLNKTHRWTGSVYVEIAASPGSTDSVTEGATNLYFTNTRARGAVSVTDAGGDGSLSYSSGTGVITYTGPGSTDYRAAFTAGTGITITSGVVATTITQGITDLVNDITPQLGGNLDTNGKNIVDSIGPLKIATANVVDPISLETRFIYLNKTGNTSGTIIRTLDASSLTLGVNDNVGGQGSIAIAAGSDGNITMTPAGTGKTRVNAINYNEGAIYDLGTTGGTVAPNVTNGNVQKITLNAALTINAFTSPIAGQSLTLIINGGTAYTAITSTMKFAGGIKTLTGTAGCIDILTVYYDGTTYYASLGKGFA